MKKLTILAAAAVLTVSMTVIASADDISVRTSVGSGEVIFTETSEAADISAEELTDLVKSALASAEEKEDICVFLDASADISLKAGEEDDLTIKAEAVGDLDRHGDNSYGNLYYSFDGMGQTMTGYYQGYNWKKDGEAYSAVSVDRGEWSVTRVDAVSEAFSSLEGVMESEQAGSFKLDNVQPNLYESEDGGKFYVCLYDKENTLNLAGSVDGAAAYAGLAGQVLGDNEVQFVVVVNAETGLPRAISLNASGASGSLIGALLGMEGDLAYSCNDLYATIILTEDVGEIEIPEEVLNAPVQESPVEDILEEIESSLGGMEESEG